MRNTLIILLFVLLAPGVFRPAIGQLNSPLAIDSLVAEALRNNPQLRAARHQTSAVKARVDQVTSWDSPQVGFELFQTPLQSFPYPAKNSMENGGEVVEMSEMEFMVRGLAESNGEGVVVGGIIVMRYGQNALHVIEGVKKQLEVLKQRLPEDVKIHTAHDHSGLIERAIETLRDRLTEEIISFIVMKAHRINANIMSLSGIAIAIGAMVDAAIIIIENAHKHIEHESLKPPEQRQDHWQVLLDASKEAGPALFYSLLVITVSFTPVFTLEGQEGRLFKPVAFTKTHSMAAAAILSITIVPILMGYWIRGKT